MVLRKLAAIIMLMAVLLLACPPGSSSAQPQTDEPVRRALLIASDFFISQTDTWPASTNNVKAVEEAFSQSGIFSLIRPYYSTLSTLEGLTSAIQAAFSDAGENDVSYFYISTHGVYDAQESNLKAYLLLSDGNQEEKITAQALEKAFEGIAGTKVLLIDACQSGALIGKGISGGTTQAAFLGPEFKVLTSAGGSEESWYWSSQKKAYGVATGSSYFSEVLCAGISQSGGYSADQNQDGAITLKELYAYLLENHGASTPQVYPQDDDFTLFTYDRAAYLLEGADSDITGISFEDTLLNEASPTVNFSFTVTRPTQLAYQLVYYHNGQWQFDSAQLIYDNQEVGGDYGDRQGYVSPGRKVRSLTLDDYGDSTYGYVMVQLITFSDGHPHIHTSRVLCVTPLKGDPQLEVKTGQNVSPQSYRELPIVVSHQYPCELTVSIYNESGVLTKRLSTRQSTRPQGLVPQASAFYWNGKTTAGNYAPAGKYYVEVTAYLGEDTYTAQSPLFEVVYHEE